MRKELRNGLRKALDGLLMPLSFHRQGGFTWNRRDGDFIDVIYIGWGKQDTQTEYGYGLGCGVVWVPAFEASRETTVPSLVHDADCTIRAASGDVLHARDLWWDSANHADEAMVQDTRDKVSHYAVPFLATMHSIEELERFLSRNERHLRFPPDLIALALLREGLGNIDGARRVWKRGIEGRASAWTPRVARLAHQFDARHPAPDDTPLTEPGRMMRTDA